MNDSLNLASTLVKPEVRICSWCQNINKPQFAPYAVDVDQTVKDEMKEVDRQVREHDKDFIFSHGICLLHLVQMYKKLPKMTDEKLKLAIYQSKTQKSGPIPCLLTNEPLRHAYMRGLFTPESIRQAANMQQEAITEFTESLKKLAGIKA